MLAARIFLKPSSAITHLERFLASAAATGCAQEASIFLDEG
jgi:hypothetical protein